MYMSQIGDNLKTFRTKAGYTQKDVEAALGLRDLMMKDLETERLKLPAELAIKLAKLYKVSLDELLVNALEKTHAPQGQQLILLHTLFAKPDIEVVFLDPVIRAFLEDYQEKVLDHSVFELLTMDLTVKQKKDFTSEVLKTLGSMMGIDGKITKEEQDFLNTMVKSFDLEERTKTISKTISHKHLPAVVHFHGKPAAKHFMIWLLFFMSQSDGQMNHEELEFIEECAEVLKINRSNYLYIKRFFVKEKY
jgi:transcriptional regulator with XRE-family HTH domain